MPTPPFAQAAIFDMDGLLLDTENLYTEATQQIAAEHGKTFEWSLKEKLMGRPAIESARIIVETLALPLEPEEYLLARQARLMELLADVQAKPGASELCQKLSHHNIPKAVATSSHRPIFNVKTQNHNWFSDFDEIITGDDPAITRGKPAPDIFLLAAERLGVKPEACIVFEDSPTGVEAALAAGMTVIAVPDPRLNRALIEQATEILDSLEAFELESWFSKKG